MKNHKQLVAGDDDGYLNSYLSSGLLEDLKEDSVNLGLNSERLDDSSQWDEHNWDNSGKTECIHEIKST